MQAASTAVAFKRQGLAVGDEGAFLEGLEVSSSWLAVATSSKEPAAGQGQQAATSKGLQHMQDPVWRSTL
jgi:hypothetical protein